MAILRILGVLIAGAGICALLLGLAAKDANASTFLITGLVLLVGGFSLALVARRKCPHCRAYVADRAQVCRECGRDIA